MTVTKRFFTVGADETLRMPLLSNRIQTVPFNSAVALGANRSQIRFVTVFAVQLALFFDESDVLQMATTLSVDTMEVLGTPRLAESRDERTSYGSSAGSADRNSSAGTGRWIENAASTSRSRPRSGRCGGCYIGTGRERFGCGTDR